MAFDPTLPADHSPLNSAEMRSQLIGLKDLIDVSMEGLAFKPSEVKGLTLSISDPPTKAEVEAIRDKVNELIEALCSR